MSEVQQDEKFNPIVHHLQMTFPLVFGNIRHTYNEHHCNKVLHVRDLSNIVIPKLLEYLIISIICCVRQMV